MDTSTLTYVPEELKRNLAITLGTQGRVLPEHLGMPAGPEMASPGPIALPQGKPPDLSIAGPQPNVKAPRGTLQGDQAERTRLMDTGSGISQISKKVQNSDFGQNHPTLGKVLGGVAQTGATIGDIALNTLGGGFGQLAAQQIPGTQEHHDVLLHQANRAVGQDEADQEKEAQTAAQQAEVPLRGAQTAEAEQRTQAATPIEITPEQAQSLGMPELAGEKVSPAVLAGLSRTNQTNNSRETVASDTNQTKKGIADTKAQSVADTNASREKIAAGANAVRTALGNMKAASGIAKGGTTMTTRAMAEMATTVLPRMTAISAEVDRLANELGPAVGRWNELMVNKGGADHPEFAHLDTDLDLLASAIVRTHFGARGGQQYRQELRKQFGEAQSPEDLKQRIAAAQDWIQGYADMEQTPPKTGAPAPQGGKHNDPLGIR